MEELAESGQFVGVIDYTTNETYDPMTGGIHDGGPDRLKRIGLLGLPQVVVPGCIDFCVFHAGSIPKELQGRPVYDHNPEYTLVRASYDEMVALGHLFAERLNLARGSVWIAVPTQGLSIPNVPNGVFWNPNPARLLNTCAARSGRMSGTDVRPPYQRPAVWPAGR
jgi:uncharacterized protein (UPF0261 family)